MQGYTKDAGQDMALEQLIWPKIPTNTGKISLQWDRLAQIRNIYMQTNTSTHLQCMHHSSLHGVHHTGRNRGVIVSHCTRDMYWRGRSVKLNKILRVHKLWPLRTTHHLNPYLPGRDFHWYCRINHAPINGNPCLQCRIHREYTGLTYKVTAFDTSWITFGWLSTSNKFYNKVRGMLKGVCRESVMPQLQIYGILGYS